MALKAVLDSVDGLSADVQKEYKKRDDGKYVLDVEAVAGLALEDVAGLKKTVQTLRGEKEQLTSTIKKFEGLDPEKAKEALQKVTEWGDMTPEQKASELLKTKEAQLAAKFAKQEEAIKAERDAATKQLDHTIRLAALSTEIAKKKGNPELLMPHALAATRMKRLDNGQYAVEVVDGDGNARISPSGSGTDLMTIPQLVEEMSAKFPSAFEASGSSGSGASGGAGAPKGNTPVGSGAVKTISRRDKDALGRNLAGIADGTIKVVD